MQEKRLYEWDLDRVFEVMTVKDAVGTSTNPMARCSLKSIRAWKTKSIVYEFQVDSPEYRVVSEWPFVFISENNQFIPVELRNRDYVRIDLPMGQSKAIFRAVN